MSINEPLAKYTSFRIGGAADLFYKAGTIQELVIAILEADRLTIPVFVIGSGTNLLAADKGFRGIVVKNETSRISLVGIRGNNLTAGKSAKIHVHTVFIKAESGVTINRLVRFTLDQGLSGLEVFLGQPGTVGGAVYINSHNLKMGKFFSDIVVEAKILDKEGQVSTVPASYFRFNYDQSLIQKTKETILSVTLKLVSFNKELIWKKAQEALEYRKLTQPMGQYSAGCTFRNINKSDAVRLATPNHTCSAGFLIESAGLKGVKMGGAQFSLEHANFIININNAKAADVLKLINLAKKKVKEKYHVEMKEEIILIGDF